jgi:hypothetical protein
MLGLLSEIMFQGGAALWLAYLVHQLFLGTVARVIYIRSGNVNFDAYFVFMGAQMVHHFVLTLVLGTVFPVLVPVCTAVFVLDAVVDKYYFMEIDCFERANPAALFATPVEFAISYSTVSLAILMSMPVVIAICLLPTQPVLGTTMLVDSAEAIGSLGVEPTPSLYPPAVPIVLLIILAVATLILAIIPRMRRRYLELWPADPKVVYEQPVLWAADGYGLSRASVGVPASFILQRLDADGLPIDYLEPPKVELTSAHGSRAALLVSRVAGAVGQLECTYVPSLEGEYKIYVTDEAGRPFRDSPFDVRVSPKAEAAYSSLNEPNLKHTVVDSNLLIFVTTRAHTNEIAALLDPQHQLQVMTRLVSPSIPHEPESAIQQVQQKSGKFDVTGSDGRYRIFLRMPATAGVYRVSVLLDGEPIRGESFAVSALPDEATSAIAFGDGIKCADTDAQAEFRLTPCDRFGNRVQLASLRGRVQCFVTDGMRELVPVVVDEHPDEAGSFKCSYTVTGQGGYTLSIYFDGIRNSDCSPFAIDVTPSISIAHSTLKVPDMSSVAAGDVVQATFVACSSSGATIETPRFWDVQVCCFEHCMHMLRRPR